MLRVKELLDSKEPWVVNGPDASYHEEQQMALPSRGVSLYLFIKISFKLW